MSKDLTISQNQIENKIFVFRNVQVMLDSDLAEMYQTETKYINRAIKRNRNRFPSDFAFQLNDVEWENLKFQLGTSSSHGGRRMPPYAFTEQGVAMLSAVLQSDLAIEISVQIIKAFVEMRKLIANHSGLLQRMDGIERKQLETDQKFEKVFKALERKDLIPNQGVFFNGQVFDAYELASKIIRSAKQNIVIIDNYIDESTFTHLAKKRKEVKVSILTKATGKQLMLDLKKANEQYGNFTLKSFSKSHDRFLIIDSEEVYHLGASLKDLGRKWFAFSKLDKTTVQGILNEIKRLMING